MATIGVDSFRDPQRPRAAGKPRELLDGVSQGLLLALVYALLAELANLTATTHREVIGFWPASGISVVAMMAAPRRRWHALLGGVFAAAMVFNALNGTTLQTDLGFSAADVVAVIVAVLVLRVGHIDGLELHGARDMGWLLLASLAGGAASGLGGAATAALTLGSSFHTVFLGWTLGEVVGIVMVPPLFTGLGAREPAALAPAQIAQACLPIALSAAVAAGVFFFTTLPLEWLPLLVTTVCGLRYGPRMAAWCVAAMGLIAISAAVRGHGNFAVGRSPEDALILVQSLLLVATPTCPVLAALVRDLAVSLGRLRASESRFRLLVEGVRDHAICMLDVDGRVIDWNVGIERLLGYSEASALGRRLVEFLNGAIALDLERALRHGRGAVEGKVVRADGEIMTVTLTVSALLDRAGAPSAMAVVLHDVTERRRAEDQLREMAAHDALTGLPNRHLLIDHLDLALAHARRETGHVGLLLCDVDRFKVINESLGHHLGDEVLQRLAERLHSVVREEDTLARMGGDEFAVCCPAIAGEGQLLRLAERLQASLSEPIALAEGDIHVSLSIGAVLADSQRARPLEMLRDADTAMYRAKERGGTVALASAEDRETAHMRLLIENDLRRAAERGELELFYQPVVELGTGRVTAVEALARWNHPLRGLLSPAAFIPLAEETGAILELGSWTLQEACRAIQRLRAATLDDELRVAVNVSAAQLVQAGFVERVREALRRAGAAPSSLVLELTESSLIEDGPASLAILEALKELGVSLAMDDFGTGYSSLSYLKHLPLDVIKVDRSFVAELGQGPAVDPILAATISIGQALGLTVVAEGIETPAQLTALREMGCRRGQGFYFSPPRPEAAVTEMLRDKTLALPPAVATPS
jgi:diguanylate cyclase (GGDEF)-like protein/PAS domain S-box-containing protein